MATAATAKQNSKERRGEEGREGRGKIKPCSGLLGVFKDPQRVFWGDAGSQVGEADHDLGADTRGVPEPLLRLTKIPDPEGWQQSRAGS